MRNLPVLMTFLLSLNAISYADPTPAPNNVPITALVRNKTITDFTSTLNNVVINFSLPAGQSDFACVEKLQGLLDATAVNACSAYSITNTHTISSGDMEQSEFRVVGSGLYPANGVLSASYSFAINGTIRGTPFSTNYATPAILLNIQNGHFTGNDYIYQWGSVPRYVVEIFTLPGGNQIYFDVMA